LKAIFRSNHVTAYEAYTPQDKAAPGDQWAERDFETKNHICGIL